MSRGRKNYVWNMERDNFVRENAGRLKDADLAVEMTRRFGHPFSLAAIRLQRKKLGVFKENGRGLCKVKNRDGASDRKSDGK